MYSNRRTFGDSVSMKKIMYEIESGHVRYVGTGTDRGYVSRLKPEGFAYRYKGRFGEGYVIVKPRWDTTTHVYIEYYVR